MTAAQSTDTSARSECCPWCRTPTHRRTDAPTTLLTAPRQVVSIDVADDVIRAGRTHEADPPRGVGGRFWAWTVLIVVALGGVVVYRCRQPIALWWDDRRVRRARRDLVRAGRRRG